MALFKAIKDCCYSLAITIDKNIAKIMSAVILILFTYI